MSIAAENNSVSGVGSGGFLEVMVEAEVSAERGRRTPAGRMRH